MEALGPLYMSQPVAAPSRSGTAQARDEGGERQAKRDGLAEALATLGDRWSPAVVAALLDGPLRFGGLQERLPAIAPNILSQRLRALASRGVIVATPYSQRPTRYAYELTSAGRELAGALRLLGDWGARQLGASVEPPRHAPCGSPLEVRWYCPACQRPVAAPADGGEEGEQDDELYFA
jgi:DNA-binding HxlR family transcriptional regulator